MLSLSPSQVANYPVVNDRMIQGLLKRYRGLILQLKAQSPVRVGQGMAVGDKDAPLELHDLEGKLIKSNLV